MDISQSRFTARTLIALASALMLFVSACGSTNSEVEVSEAGAEASDAAADSDSTSTDGAADDSQADESEDDSADDAGDTEAFVDDGEGSPLAQLMGWPTGPGDFDEDQAIEEQRQIESTIARCMLEKGWEYTPRDVTNDVFFGGSWPGEGLSEEEYAEQYGFGMSTTFDQMFEGPSEEQMAEMEQFSDPNDERISQMSEGERDAYFLDLHGEQPDFDPETGMPIDPETGEPTEDFSPFEGGGCQNEAYADVYGKYDALNELNDEFEEMYERIQADPRIIKIAAEWSACMAEEGHNFDGPDEMFEDFYGEFDELQNEIFAASFDMPDRKDIELDDEGNPVEGSLPPEFFGPPPLTDEQEARLAEFQAREITLAVADLACRVDREEIYAEVQREAELQFIEDNRAALDAAIAGSS